MIKIFIEVFTSFSMSIPPKGWLPKLHGNSCFSLFKVISSNFWSMFCGGKVGDKRTSPVIDPEEETETKKPKLERSDGKPLRYHELKDAVADGNVLLQEAEKLLSDVRNGQADSKDVKSVLNNMVSASQQYLEILKKDVVLGNSDKANGDSNDMVLTVKNLPKDWNKDRFVAFLDKKSLKYKSVEKELGDTKAEVQFESVEDEGKLFAALDAFKIQDKWLAVYKSAASNRNDNGKAQKSEAGEKKSHRKKGFQMDGGQSRDIRDMVTPYRDLPYQEQLKKKHEKLVYELQRVTKCCADIHEEQRRPEWLVNALAQDSESPVCCPIEGILQSPQLHGYRNKTEFTIGFDLQEKPTIGFLLGAFKDGITAVAEASGCVNISPISIKFAQIVQQYLREKSNLKPWDKRISEGFWRLLIVREARAKTFLPLPEGGVYENSQGEEINFANLEWKKWMVRIPGEWEQECYKDQVNISNISDVGDERVVTPDADEVMIVVQVNPKGEDQAEVTAELSALEQYLHEQIKQQQIECKIVMLVQHHTGVSNSAPARAPLVPFPGEAEKDGRNMFITDTLLNLKFQISFQAFFQVNSGAASCLYALVNEWTQVGPKTLFLDICCGTGTIGLTQAGTAKRVIGIDNVKSAIDDAQKNSEINGVQNCEWVCGTAESKMKFILKDIEDQIGEDKEYNEIVAVVDPPRAGLHKHVISAILACPYINKFYS
eukprot:TRINITY_DN744_c0_g2_i1.p1 TRINITY_DN744_c0_g2~~TRINITY_DN744_c0_g2_i1.p1  ORF type:complete len:715 (-),score=108.57 TRINITY_DN744_c0_g2_i1:65-2209(-)